MTTTRSGDIRHTTANDRDGSVRQALGWMVRYPRLAWDNRDVVWTLVRLDLLGRFRGSLLGVFWVLAQPLFLFAVYYTVFGFVFAPVVPEVAAADGGFALYLFAGILAWGAFSGTIARACTALTNSANLVKYASFPSEILPLPLVVSELIVYLAGAAVLVVVGTLTRSLTLDATILALPLLLVVHGTLTLGFALAVATSQVVVRDTAHLYGVVAMAWLFLSPVFWRIDLLSAGSLGPLASLFRLNPAYSLLQAHRAVLGVPGGEPQWLWWHLGATALWAVLWMTVGYALFARQKRDLADLV